MEEMSSMFFTMGGKTFYGKDRQLFGDFIIKVVGEMKLVKKKTSGRWVCLCGTADSDQDNTTRCVMTYVVIWEVRRIAHSRLDILLHLASQLYPITKHLSH
jgi:hypothetical protein